MPQGICLAPNAHRTITKGLHIVGGFPVRRLLSLIIAGTTLTWSPLALAQDGVLPWESQDPTNFILPARPIPRSVNTFQLRRMKQQLGELVERVQAIVTLAQMQKQEQPVAGTVQAIAFAESVLGQLDGWIAQGQEEWARSQWLQAQALLWQNYPALAAQTKPEVRAIWLDRETIVKAGSEAGVVPIFDRLRAAGVNLVFFETVNAGYPIYPSRVTISSNNRRRYSRAWGWAWSRTGLSWRGGITLPRLSRFAHSGYAVSTGPR